MSGSFRALNEFKAVGADVCFSKPFHIDEIENAIENIWSADQDARTGINDSYRSYSTTF